MLFSLLLAACLVGYTAGDTYDIAHVGYTTGLELNYLLTGYPGECNTFLLFSLLLAACLVGYATGDTFNIPLVG